MRQTRQAVHAIKQSISLDVYGNVTITKECHFRLNPNYLRGGGYQQNQELFWEVLPSKYYPGPMLLTWLFEVKQRGKFAGWLLAAMSTKEPM
jgi:hypothetical protein